MTEQITEMSPRLKARITGLFYLIAGQAYSFAEFSVRGKLVVHGDAAATAQNILAHQSLFLWGFAAELISGVFFITVTLLFYNMFKPVNRSLSLLAAFFSLTGCIIGAVSSLFHLAPLVVLGGDQYFRAFNVNQLQGLGLMFLTLRTLATNIYMEFFGCYNLLLGYLIFRSKFLPRILGVFMAIAGLSYQLFLSPPLAKSLFPYVVAPAGTLGELSLILWLLVVDVNTQRWKEQASTAGPSPIPCFRLTPLWSAAYCRQSRGGPPHATLRITASLHTSGRCKNKREPGPARRRQEGRRKRSRKGPRLVLDHGGV